MKARIRSIAKQTFDGITGIEFSDSMDKVYVYTKNMFTDMERLAVIADAFSAKNIEVGIGHISGTLSYTIFL